MQIIGPANFVSCRLVGGIWDITDTKCEISVIFFVNKWQESKGPPHICILGEYL